MSASQLYQSAQEAFALISQGHFDEAKVMAEGLLVTLLQQKKRGPNFYIMAMNIAGLFIDIGHQHKDSECADIGLQLMLKHEQGILKITEPQHYYYNLGNAKSNMISLLLTEEQSFESILELMSAKQYFWKAIKAAEAVGPLPAEYATNLANNLTRQFRLTEALDWYEPGYRENIFQAHINRSDTLKLLNVVSHHYTIKLLDEVAKGYERVVAHAQFPPPFRPYYEHQARSARNIHKKQIAEHGVDANDDEHADAEEFEKQSDYRKFCLNNPLALSEHSLYCPCAASARDNLTIPTASDAHGDFVIEMEAVLNRLKSEFSFARRMYFESLHDAEDEELQYESCFSELFNGELLGLNVEKLRTAFRFCFGMLDKIAEAICALHALQPKKGPIYFHSFWQLEVPGRMAQFEAVKSPGLLALYSIATDLNSDGEWAFFKDWRNALEHRQLVIHPDDPIDLLTNYTNSPGGVRVSESQFKHHLEQMLRLTRSAIFSFVFAVREKAQICDGQTPLPLMKIQRQHFQ